jgi:hypothetical protein
MPGFNRINEEEFNKRLIALFNSLKIYLESGQVIYNQKATKEQVSELFALYNDRNHKKEWGYTCSACVNRVYNTMKELYEKINN